MIARKNDRSFGRDVFDTNDVDTPKKGIRDYVYQRDD